MPPFRSTTRLARGSSRARRPTRPPTPSSTPGSISRCSRATANTSSTGLMPHRPTPCRAGRPGLVDGGPATAQVYSWTIAEPDPFQAVTLISALPDGSPSTAGAAEPDVSRSGRRSPSPRPIPRWRRPSTPNCATDCPSQVFIADRDSDDDGEIGIDEIATVDIVSVSNEAISGDRRARRRHVTVDAAVDLR